MGGPDVEALLQPVILGGRLLDPMPTAAEARAHAAACLREIALALP